MKTIPSIKHGLAPRQRCPSVGLMGMGCVFAAFVGVFFVSNPLLAQSHGGGGHGGGVSHGYGLPYGVGHGRSYGSHFSIHSSTLHYPADYHGHGYDPYYGGDHHGYGYYGWSYPYYYSSRYYYPVVSTTYVLPADLADTNNLPAMTTETYSTNPAAPAGRKMSPFIPRRLMPTEHAPEVIPVGAPEPGDGSTVTNPSSTNHTDASHHHTESGEESK